LPFVATAVGGVPALAEGTGGVLCPPSDPQALATAIAGALDRRPQIDPAALAEHARQRFGYEAIARIWAQIYDELRSSAGTTSSASVRRTTSGR
jgi:glycosyltransferase involved in cell wall biosynthesis